MTSIDGPYDIKADLTRRIYSPSLWRDFKPWEGRMLVAVLPILTYRRLAKDVGISTERVRQLLERRRWPAPGTRDDELLRAIFKRIAEAWRDWEIVL